MHVTVSVAVAGASGYAGAELMRLLSNHPHVELGALTAHTNAGENIGTHHPHLRTFAHRDFAPTTPEVLADHDVVFLALPHGASAQIASQLAPSTLIIDCGADFRLEDAAAWQQYYGGEHAGTWTYGMPELIRGDGSSQRELIAQSRRIAVPGCNVMAVTLALQPAFLGPQPAVDSAGIVAVLANGYSGAGKVLKPHLMASEAFGTATPYAVGGGHRHIPEIEQNLRHAGANAPRLSFTPTLVPMARGILATVSAPLLEQNSANQERAEQLGAEQLGAKQLSAEQFGAFDESALRAKWEQAYGNESAVELLPPGQWPTTAATTGANIAQVQIAVDKHAGRLVAVSALDNLVKGTAGTAIQSMNLALGFDEHTALSSNGVAP